MHIRVRESGRRVQRKPVKRYQAVWYEQGREFRETCDTREPAWIVDWGSAAVQENPTTANDRG
ncbi:MAG: hypothetical protein QOC76_3297 [Mycobacterium sp.]|jgi:hypothetical protein|nr:hypothetical protein [Mycobacterium sp.]